LKKAFNILVTIGKSLEAAELVGILIFVIVAVIKGE